MFIFLKCIDDNIINIQLIKVNIIRIIDKWSYIKNWLRIDVWFIEKFSSIIKIK